MTLKQDSDKKPLVRSWGTQNTAISCLRFMIAVVITFTSFTGYLEAEEGDIFTVSDVHVDVTSSSSADARTEAIANGQRNAFQILLQRLVRSDALSRLPQLSAVEIDQYVRDFTVNNERNSPIRYLADLTFRFKATKIRILLRDLQVEFAQTVRKPVLILPIYEVAAAKSLWEKPNPWWAAWSDLNPRVGLVPFRYPAGDLKDVGIIGAEQAVSGDKPRIKEIRERYKVDTVLVVHANLISGPKGQAAVRIKILSYGSDHTGEPEEEQFNSGDNENINDLLERAANVTRISIEDNWKEINFIKFEQGSVLAASIPIESLTDWVDAKRRLENVAIIERIDLILISRNEALINIYYLGEDQQLTVALAQADMKLVQEEGSWTLILRKNSGDQKKIREN